MIDRTRRPRAKAKARVRVLGPEGVFYVHPAVARKRRRREDWHRPRGSSFRLKAWSKHQHATASSDASGRASRTPVLKIALYGSGQLRCHTGHAFSDARVLRGAILASVKEAFGQECAWYLSNHGTSRKSPIVVSLSRHNARRAFLTLTAPGDPDAAALFRELPSLLKGRELLMGDGGPGTHAIRVLEADVVEWVPRGVYLDVMGNSSLDACAKVPGAIRARRMRGLAGRGAERAPYKVRSMRKRRLPVQVGSMGAYGYGVLV